MSNFLLAWTVSHARQTAQRYGPLFLVVLTIWAAGLAPARAQDASLTILDVSALLPGDRDVTAPQSASPTGTSTPPSETATTPVETPAPPVETQTPPAGTSGTPVETQTPAGTSGTATASTPGQTSPIPNTTPALPPHTGLSTLVRDTVHDYAAFPQRESTWWILGIGGALAAAFHPLDDDINSHLVSSSAADKIWKPGHIIGGPVIYVVPVALYIGGRYLLPNVSDENQTNKLSHLGLDMVRAELLEEGIVQALKFSVRRERPDGSNNQSFPSGHAAVTFAVASVLERHLGYRAAWPTFVIATYVATSRLHDNVHFLSDVLFGAAIGTASGWTVVGRHGRTNYAVSPVPVPGGFAVMVTPRSKSSN
jgi:membrane-associated phospholipid phosphatase